MLTPGRTIALHYDSGNPLPEIPELRDLYSLGSKGGGEGVTIRHGQVVMIAGRSGTQKSGLALWLSGKWAEQGISSLYYSADMAPFTASARMASMFTGYPTRRVEEMMHGNDRERKEIMTSLEGLPITFAFGHLSWPLVDQHLEAFVELNDSYPDIIWFDNLMDFENAESDYSVQMAVMSTATSLARETGSTVVLMHHASDKSWDAKTSPFEPPSRQEIKGGLSEKPELSLSVALDPHSLEYRIACIKQRSGPSDPTAQRYATIICEPEVTRFHARGETQWR